MRKRVLFLGLIVVISISSCGFKEKHEAQEFYIRMNLINDTLSRMTIDWHNEFSNDTPHKNFGNLSTYRTTLGEFISRTRQNINNQLPTAENQKIINDEQTLLENEASIVTDVYPNFELLSELTPRDIFQKDLNLLGNDLGNEQAVITSIRTELLAYAKKYGLKSK